MRWHPAPEATASWALVETYSTCLKHISQPLYCARAASAEHPRLSCILRYSHATNTRYKPHIAGSGRIPLHHEPARRPLHAVDPPTASFPARTRSVRIRAASSRGTVCERCARAQLITDLNSAGRGARQP